MTLLTTALMIFSKKRMIRSSLKNNKLSKFKVKDTTKRERLLRYPTIKSSLKLMTKMNSLSFNHSKRRGERLSKTVKMKKKRRYLLRDHKDQQRKKLRNQMMMR